MSEPSCEHFGQKWDPDDSGLSRCYDCLEAEGWEYDAEYDEGWRDKWERSGPKIYRNERGLNPKVYED